jgi:hypothetical protein
VKDFLEDIPSIITAIIAICAASFIVGFVGRVMGVW